MVNSAFGLVLVPVYTKYLPASQFGVLSLMTITLTLVTIFLKFGLNHAFFRHYYETEDEAHRRRIVGSTFVFLLVSAALLTLLLAMLAPQVSALVFGAEERRADLLRLVFFISFFEVMSVIPDSILRANFKSARYSAINVVAFAFQLILIAYLVIVADAGVEGVLIGRLAGVAFETFIFYFMVRRELSLSFSTKELRGMLSFGVPLIFGQISFTLFMMIDRFFLERYATKQELGAYAMACTLVSVVSVLVTVPFSQVWTVMRFSVMNEEGADEYYSRVLTYIVFVSMFLALGVAAVAGDGLLLYALKSYWAAALIIPLLALSAVLDCASRVLNIGITLKKRTIYAPIVISIALAVNIALNILFIKHWRFGIMGATAATLISYVVFCALRYWASNRFYKVRYEWGRVFTLLAVGSLVIALYYLADYMRGSGASRGSLYLSLLTKVALAVSFPLVLFGLRFFDERERRRLAEFWQKALLVVRRRRINESVM